MHKKFISWIKVIGAKEHNLKNINVQIPKESLTVITGPSGSGKSSLALDVLYTEGKRRYIESLSSYARQFLGLPRKPDVEAIEGLCPAIAIDQKTIGSNPRSTVGTITEIYDYLRVLFARVGKPYCPNCNLEIEAHSPDKVALAIANSYLGKTVSISAPIAIRKKGEFTNILERLFNQGYYKFLIDEQVYTIKNHNNILDLNLKKTLFHNIDVIIDSCTVSADDSSRLQEAIDKAFSVADGLCKISIDGQEKICSAKTTCISCGYYSPEVEPRLFSFNSPLGACHECNGLGNLGINAYYNYQNSINSLEEFNINLESEYMQCPSCHGKRLNNAALAVFINKNNIYDLSILSIKKLILFFDNLKLSEVDTIISERLLQEIRLRLKFLLDVGLGYLSLNRSARTLSGGEGQRIRLATQIGSALSGVLYILDEPSIGLHQKDNDKLIQTLHNLKNLGNTVIVVEHDTDTMQNADYIIDMGPAAGAFGGQVIFAGTPQEILNDPHSLTGQYLSGKKMICVPHELRKPKGFITLFNARANNLKDLTVKFPLGVLCSISGVSGSGKSSLIMQELIPSMEKFLKFPGLENDKLENFESILNMVVIDQKPIGRTPRSTPATYLGIFDDIRAIFASLPESNIRGYTVGRFSFNLPQGRCSNCNGDGVITISMHFLADVTMVCNVCKGLRYNKQTREIKFKGHDIAQILDMSALQAKEFFAAHKNLHKKLELLCQVGLDYIKLGQPSTTLSGGEAQRVKLVAELAKRGSNTLYILDEPTTGLHPDDIAKLLKVLNSLVDKGNSLLVIEHNLDVLKVSDYIIDLGPDGGDEGGYIVAHGTPAQVCAVTNSYTGQYLKKVLDTCK